MSSSYRERVTALYQKYNPEKLSDVASLLDRCNGDEEALIKRLVEKYGPEPPAASSAAPSGVAISASNVAPIQASPSFARPSATFGTYQQSDDEDDDLSMQPTAVSASTVFAPAPDPYAQLKTNLANEVGFINMDDKRKWEDAWLGKMPLANLRRSWGDTEIAAAQGYKFAVHGKPQRWQKRYFVLVPNFLYYFDSDSPNAPCKGAVYLDRAAVTVEEKLQERKAIVVKPRVYKKPLEVVAGGDVSSFKIAFDADKTQEKWKEVLEKMTKILPVAPAAAVASIASPMSSVASPQSFRQSQSMRRAPVESQQQQQQYQQAAAPEFQGVGSPAPAQPADQQTPLRLPAPPSFAQQAAASPPVPSGFFQPPPSQLQSAVSPAFSQLQRNDSKRFDQAALALQQQQQQQLHQQALELQRQQFELAEKQRQQAQQNLLQLNIDSNDIKARIKKISKDRDPIGMVETLLNFVYDHVSNANQLWHLMDEIDNVPKLPDPALAGQSLLLQAASSGVLNNQMWDSVARAGASPQMTAALLQQQQQQQQQGSSFPSPVATLPMPQPIAKSSISPTREQVITRFVDEKAKAIERIRGNYSEATSNRGAVMMPSRSPDRRSGSSSYPQQQQQPIYERVVGPLQGGLVDDHTWEDRMTRIRNRKMMVENILNDLPQ